MPQLGHCLPRNWNDLARVFIFIFIYLLSNFNGPSVASPLQNGKLPRNLPALRAMEMALRTNSFATPPRAARTEGGGQDMEDSDEEMEYMPPLHSEYECCTGGNKVYQKKIDKLRSQICIF